MDTEAEAKAWFIMHGNELAKAVEDFADEAVRNCNKTSGNGEEATREPDLNSAARKPMQ